MSFVDRMKETINTPFRHFKTFFEPDGINYSTQAPETAKLHGNTAMTFNAYLAQNSIDLNNWHEMENTVHSQFGTVDNPVLIFSSDSAWR